MTSLKVNFLLYAPNNGKNMHVFLNLRLPNIRNFLVTFTVLNLESEYLRKLKSGPLMTL